MFFLGLEWGPKFWEPTTQGLGGDGLGLEGLGVVDLGVKAGTCGTLDVSHIWIICYDKMILLVIQASATHYKLCWAKRARLFLQHLIQGPKQSESGRHFQA